MKLTYLVDEKDHLEYLMYNSSKSEQHKKSRLRSRWIITGVCVLVALWMYSSGLYMAAGIYFLLAIIAFAFYNKYSKRRYSRFFQKSVAERYNDSINQNIEIEMTPEYIAASDDSSDSKIKTSAVLDLTELNDHFLLRMSAVQSFVIPKRCLESVDQFKQYVQSLGIAYKDDSNWTWK